MRKIIASVAIAAVAIVATVGFAVASHAAPPRTHGAATSSHHPAWKGTRTGTYTIHKAAPKAAKGSIKPTTTQFSMALNPKARSGVKKSSTIHPSFVNPCFLITLANDPSGDFTGLGLTAAYINPTGALPPVINASNCNFGVFVGPGHVVNINNTVITGAGFATNPFFRSAAVVNNGGHVTVNNSALDNSNYEGAYNLDSSLCTTGVMTINNSTVQNNGDFIGGFGADTETFFGCGASTTLNNVHSNGNATSQVDNFDFFCFGDETTTISGGVYSANEPSFTFAGAPGLVNECGTTNATGTQFIGNTDAGVYNLFGAVHLNTVTVQGNDLAPFLFPAASAYNDFGSVMTDVYGVFGTDPIFAGDAVFNDGSANFSDASFENDGIGFENVGPFAEIGNSKAVNNITFGAPGIWNHSGGLIYISSTLSTGNGYGLWNGDEFGTFYEGSDMIVLGGASDNEIPTGNAFDGIVNFDVFYATGTAVNNNGGDGYFQGPVSGGTAQGTFNHSSLHGNLSGCDFDVSVATSLTLNDTSYGTFCTF